MPPTLGWGSLGLGEPGAGGAWGWGSLGLGEHWAGGALGSSRGYTPLLLTAHPLQQTPEGSWCSVCPREVLEEPLTPLEDSGSGKKDL